MLWTCSHHVRLRGERGGILLQEERGRLEKKKDNIDVENERTGQDNKRHVTARTGCDCTSDFK